MLHPIRNQRGGITPRQMLVIAIVAGSIFSVSDYVGAYWQWYKVRSAALEIAQFSRGMSDEQIKADLQKALKVLKITKYSNVMLQREPVDQSKVHLSFDYIRPIFVPPVEGGVEEGHHAEVQGRRRARPADGQGSHVIRPDRG
ncbi:MAG: hypothetical protein IPK07_32405 [Deltaproteobacteria bacterium]|nr:hypothetical protein [Deltaproteobacteria bacterium]